MAFCEAWDVDTVRKKGKVNLDRLGPWVDAGGRVITINPTCSMMLRREYPRLVDREDRKRAQKLADAVRDPGEYLWSIRKEDRFNTDFRSTPGGTIAYHAPCHLRAQSVGFRGRDLMGKIPGVQPQMTLECCGHDGTWAMRVQGYESSIQVGKKAFDGMKAADAVLWSTDCPLAAVQFEQHGGREALHPMTVLARAYRAPGEGGFEQAVEGETS